MFDLNPAMMFGVSVCSLVLGQLTVAMLRGAQGLVAEREQFRLRKKLLETEVEYLQRLCESSRQQVQGWEGLRKFRVDRKVLECLDTVSLYLKPHDGKPLPAFHPGQYLTFSFRIPGSKLPVVRCYSLSDSPSPDYYRITVHKIGAAAKGRRPGLVSSYIVEQLAEGDLVDVKAPAGHFYLDLNNSRPIALVAAGVGVTPLISMVNAVCERGMPQRTRMILGVRNGHCHPFKRNLADLQRQHPHLTVETFYSRPLPEDREGVDYAHQGRVT
ncbi:MAG: hypothetical protein KDB14_13985, partial [Planctomycetales bacterium]|nr:hypothetical protein [Planctomycetales bacterium]